MRKVVTNRSALLAAAMLSAVAAGVGVAGAPMDRPVSGKNRRPTLPRMDTELAREIAEWNAAVDARKQAKALARQRREAKAS